MIISIDNRAATVTLGRQGENLARTICIDISRWVEEFGDGTAVLLAQRPNETSTYPATVTETSYLGIPSDCIIYVPEGSLEAYQTATYWSEYADQMQEE